MVGTNGTNGNDVTAYSVPKEAEKLFREGIINNPLISKQLPAELDECSKTIKFVGTDKPSIPINWRFAESISSIKALEGATINLLLKKKYGLEPQEIIIDTYVSSLLE
jgi:hypothetical protein